MKRVPVHADGGACHGTPLVDGRCPGCGLTPDMQSVELWMPDAFATRGARRPRIDIDLDEARRAGKSGIVVGIDEGTGDVVFLGLVEGVPQWSEHITPQAAIDIGNGMIEKGREALARVPK